jgi:hypothetical protein
LSVGTTLEAGPRFIDNRPKARDLQVSALYNFNIQTTIARPTSSGESSWTKWTPAAPSWLL